MRQNALQRSFSFTFSDKTLSLVVQLFFNALALLAIYISTNKVGISYALVGSTFFARLVFFRYLELKNHLSQTIIWHYLELAFFGHHVLKWLLLSESLPAQSLEMASALLLLYASMVFLFSNFKLKPLQFVGNTHHSKLNPKFTIIIFIALCFSVSALSHFLGIAKMGVTRPVLPYKLEPLLNLFRGVSVPIMFTLFINHLRSTKKWQIGLLISYLFWLALETYIRGSRGAIVVGLLPVIFYAVHVLPRKNLIKALSAFILFGVLSFQIGNWLRQSYVNTGGQKSEVQAKELLWTMYFRVFNEPQIFDRFIDHFKVEIWRNNYSFFKANESLNNYYTHRILSVPKNAAHSEGITALTDGFAYFGLIGLILTLVILGLIAKANDDLLTAKPAIHAILTWQLFNWLFWAEGFWDFYLHRSILTILVFPLSLAFSHLALRKLRPLT